MTQARVMQLSCKTFIYHPVAQHCEQNGEVILETEVAEVDIVGEEFNCWLCLGPSKDGITGCLLTSLFPPSPDLIVV